MKFLVPLATVCLTTASAVAEAPKVFAGLLEQDTPVKAQIGSVEPPQEFIKYASKIEVAVRKDPKWFKEQLQKGKAAPLPFDERLGLTKQEYDEYIALWNRREFRPREEVVLMLRQSAPGTWSIASTGGASLLSTLRYVASDDLFRSPNGDLKRISDIKADASSILGEWNGMEWKFEEETTLGKTKENFAIGKYADNKYGLIVYHMQELSSEGTNLLEKSLVVRLPLGKGAAAASKPAPVKDAKPAPAGGTSKPAPAKPAAKPTPSKPAKR